MKNLLTIATLFSAASLSFGQGIIDFENFNNSPVSTSGPTTGLISGPVGSYYFALMQGFINATSIDATLDNGTSLANGGWIFSGNLAKNTSTPGLLNGNYTTDPGVDIIGGPSGYPENFAVIGWSANIGTTYADAKAWWNNGNPNSGQSGYFGISDIAQDVLVGGNPYPVPTIFGPTPGGEIQGFTLNYYSVPEPSTFALAGLGVVAFLAFGHRRQEQSNHFAGTQFLKTFFSSSARRTKG